MMQTQITYCIITIISLLIIGCSGKIEKNDIRFIIDEGIEKYDLKNNLYTVERNNGEVKIQFSLSKNEIRAIIDEYYKLDITSLDSLMHFHDHCSIMPKDYTTLLVVEGERIIQKIEIDANCNDFYFGDLHKAKCVKSFLNLIEQKIKLKPEMKDVPKSDILLL